MRRKRTKAQHAAARFFVRVGQVGEATSRDERTLPLFPLWLILDADGTLAEDCKAIVERTQA